MGAWGIGKCQVIFYAPSVYGFTYCSRELCEVAPLRSPLITWKCQSQDWNRGVTQSLCSFFFKAVPAAYGHSQARGQIGAVHQIGAYTTATATLDLSRICDLCHSLQQRGILNPPSEASD